MQNIIDPYPIDRLPQMMLHDMEAIEDVGHLRSLFGDHVEIVLPHVCADELQGLGALGSELVEECFVFDRNLQWAPRLQAGNRRAF